MTERERWKNDKTKALFRQLTTEATGILAATDTCLLPKGELCRILWGRVMLRHHRWLSSSFNADEAWMPTTLHVPSLSPSLVVTGHCVDEESALEYSVESWSNWRHV